jgi:hypothetical protein
MKKVIRLTESDLTRIVKRVIDEEKVNIVKKSDIDDLGTWDPEILVNKKEGNYLYIMKDGKYVKIKKVPSKKPLSGKDNRHKNNYAEFMKPETAQKINDLLGQANELEKQVEKLKQKAKDLKD